MTPMTITTRARPISWARERRAAGLEGEEDIEKKGERARAGRCEAAPKDQGWAAWSCVRTDAGTVKMQPWFWVTSPLTVLVMSVQVWPSVVAKAANWRGEARLM